MGKDLASGNILNSHLRLYKLGQEPYDETYVPEHDTPLQWWEAIEPEPDYLQELALKVLSIIPNSASCERNFSLLSWLTNNRRLQLKVQNLESIAKMCCFFNTNAKKELSYFSANMTKEQVLQVLNEANGQVLEEEIIDQEDLLNFIDFIDRPSSNTRSAVANRKLFLESSLNLNEELFSDDLEYIFEDDDNSLMEESSETLDEEETEELNEGVGIFNWDPNDLEYDDSDNDNSNSDNSNN
jgi:hypothetical protein